jgi:hypothetical protein
MIRKKFSRLYHFIKQAAWEKLHKHDTRIFCIGLNKTGTTSLERALIDLGYKMGNQKKAELLTRDYLKGDFDKIISFCSSAIAFQDSPFSYPKTWRYLVKSYPNARYIYTYREPEDWYNSITRFHSKKFSKNKEIPTREELQKAKYRYPGMMWDFYKANFPTDEPELYKKETIVRLYKERRTEVEEYFEGKENLLILDVSHQDSYKRLCTFLGKEPIYDTFPHLNKT